LVVAWLGFGAFVSLGNGYNFDLPAPFFLGLAGVFGVALVLLLWFRLPRIFIQGLITLMLVIAGLPLVDHLARPKSRLERHIDHLEKYYSYEAAKKDPEAYLAWANYSMNKFMEFERKGMIRKRIGDVPFWLRPNTRAMLYDSEVSINSLGFRGREFSRHKTNTYRIIALGESTTFGMTVTPDHHPWPELLEAMIRDRLKLRKPVEVINAGVPGRILPQNVYWLKHELLDFEPDMLISYHGYNGFSLLNSAIPPPYGPPPPHYNLRPLKLLADVEYHVKLSIYRRTRTGPLTSNTPAFSDPLQTSYADAYRELIDAARSRNIRLVLANFSMAVKPDSDPDIIQFYRGGFPAIYSQLKANQAHSLMVEQLAAQHPEVCFVDTHPNLDGEHDKFIDLVHFDKSGEEQMAETFFAKNKPLLEKDCY